jgi:hypothetical protein
MDCDDLWRKQSCAIDTHPLIRDDRLFSSPVQYEDRQHE